MAVDSPELRKGIIHNLVLQDDFCNQVLPYISEDYFSEKSERIVFEEIQKYYSKYGTPPKYSALKIEVDSRNDLTEGVYNEVQAILNTKVEPIRKVEFLIDKTEQWCRERAVVNAVYEAVNVIGGENKKINQDALPDLLQKAISVSFDNSVGHDYIEPAEDRWEFYNRKEEKIPSGLEHFYYIMRGGFPSKTLGVIMAGTGVGKSVFMCSMSSNLIDTGHNVLYITMEMAEEKIAQRIDQNLLNLTQEELDTISKNSFFKRFENLKSKTKGRLVVKEYPTKSAHAGHFKALIQELKQKKDFIPDLICVDYLNICKSMSAGKNSNSYEQIKSTAEELRALAMEFNVPVLTATQTNRSGYGDADVDMTSVSESFGLPMTADYFFALSTNDKLREEGLMRFTQLKNRYGSPDDRRNWLVGIDYAKMRITDLDSQPRSIEDQNEAVRNPVTDTGKVIEKINWG